METKTIRELALEQAFRHADLNERATSPDNLLRTTESMLIPGVSYSRYLAKDARAGEGVRAAGAGMAGMDAAGTGNAGADVAGSPAGIAAAGADAASGPKDPSVAGIDAASGLADASHGVDVAASGFDADPPVTEGEGQVARAERGIALVNPVSADGALAAAGGGSRGRSAQEARTERIRILSSASIGHFGILEDCLIEGTFELTDRTAARLEQYRLHEGDVLVPLGLEVATDAPLRSVVATADDAGALVPRGFVAIHLDEEARKALEPVYLASQLNSSEAAQALAEAVGARRGGKAGAVALADLLDLAVPLAPLEEQRELVPAYEAGRAAELADARREWVRLSLYSRAVGTRGGDDADGWDGLSQSASAEASLEASAEGERRFMEAIRALAGFGRTRAGAVLGSSEPASYGTLEHASYDTSETPSWGAAKTASYGTLELATNGTPETPSWGAAKTASYGMPDSAGYAASEPATNGTPEPASYSAREAASYGMLEPASYDVLKPASYGSLDAESHGMLESPSDGARELSEASPWSGGGVGYANAGSSQLEIPSPAYASAGAVLRGSSATPGVAPAITGAPTPYGRVGASVPRYPAMPATAAPVSVPSATMPPIVPPTDGWVPANPQAPPARTQAAGPARQHYPLYDVPLD